MIRVLAFVLLVLLSDVVRADVGVALRFVPVQLTLTVDRDYPDFEFFLVETEGPLVQQISPTTREPAVILHTSGRQFMHDIYVIPKIELAKIDHSLPTAEWFKKNNRDQYRAGSIFARPSLDIFDNRKQIEKLFQIHQVQNAFQVDLVSENKGDLWVFRFWTGVCCVLPAIVIPVTGIWLIRRFIMKTSSTPKPTN